MFCFQSHCGASCSVREKCEVVLLLITYRPYYRGGGSLRGRRVNWSVVAEVLPRQQCLIYGTQMANVCSKIHL